MAEPEPNCLEALLRFFGLMTLVAIVIAIIIAAV